MSEQANGWLLIFGGLAIGLVLWLWPSHAKGSPKVEATARERFGGFVRRLAEGTLSSCQIGANEASLLR